MDQKTALNILKSGKNVFLTGSAGAGKTYVLNQYIEYLRDRGVPLAVTASTGIAATHLGGQTIHSWSGLGIRDELTEADLEKIAKKRPVRNRISKAQVLIIDEISMLSRESLECIDQILRYIKINFQPFGGIQVIFSGDFFQLPPVSKERKSSHEKFAFMAPVWVKTNLVVCYLTESYRHGNSDLLSLLNEIREGEISESSVALLQEKLEDSQEKGETSDLKLFTHNADVDRINEAELEKIDSEERSFEAILRGSAHVLESLKKSILAPEYLTLKEGAQVMFVKNNPEAGYLNGTMGTVVEFHFEGFPIVETFDGRRIFAKPEEWSIVDELNMTVASFSQIPLRLAWAITVHKSQGMTLDRAEVDLSKTFEAGQGYVALSRVKSWSGLTLLGCNNRALLMDELVMRADVRFRELSQEHEAAFQEYSDKELNKNFDQFILRSGGTLSATQIEENKKRKSEPLKVLEKKGPKISTYEQTRILIAAGKNLEEIAAARELSTGTIVTHLQKLKVDFPDLNISKFQPQQKMLDAVKKAIETCEENAITDDFDSDGKIKLGLIHRELKGEVGYEEIKLCLVFL